MIDILNIIPIDKYKHFGVCFIITFVIGIIAIFLNVNSMGSSYCGFCAALSAGFAKEYGDVCSDNNHWDWKDIIADILGALVGAGIIYII